MIYVVLITSLITTVLTIWTSGGVSDSGWERYFYDIASNNNMPELVCEFFGIFVLKLFDVIVGAALIAILYRLLPKKLKYDKKDMPN